MRRKHKSLSLTAVDLFAGGGGLTVGLRRAGFHVVGAVEIESHAFATYKANHPTVHAFKEDIRNVSGKSLLALSPTGQIDLVAGCPPCQGFSSLTSKYPRPDPRNELIREMGRLIREIRPKAVMMENVPGLALKGKPLLEEFLGELEALGYLCESDVLQVADFGIPQNRRRLVLLAGQSFGIKLPDPTHDRDGFEDRHPWRTTGEIIRHLPKPITLEEANERGGPGEVNWHIVRALSSRNLGRLKQARPGKHWRSIPKRLRPKCHQDKDAGFSNVYGRMTWDKIAPTITGGCTTLSKGRFGHPEEDRTISVHEAALLQTFPGDYIFDTPYMEYVCNIIGNALPCDFAETLARQCAAALRRQFRRSK